MLNEEYCKTKQQHNNVQGQEQVHKFQSASLFFYGRRLYKAAELAKSKLTRKLLKPARRRALSICV
jgi:hypothetical protein